MLLNIRTAFIKLFLLILLSDLVSGQQIPQQITQQSPGNSTLSFSIDDNGIVAADVRLVRPQNMNSTDSISNDKYGLLIVVLPIALDTNARIHTAVNTRIAPIHTARSFTILAVICSPGTSELDIRIDGSSRIVETVEGKGKFELDFSYPFMSQAERDLLNSPITISSFDTSIFLPKRFDETEVNYDRGLFSTKDGQTFTLAAQNAKQLGASRLWIVFPSPMKSNLDRAVMIVVFLISCFGLFFHSEAFKERRIKWSVGVLLSSLIVLGLTVFFTYTLAKRMEFLMIASASVPQIIYGMLASIYLLFATKYQATIVGEVTIEGKLTDLVEVTLYRIQDNTPIKMDSTKSLKNGKYTFHIWPKAVRDRYQVKAKGQYTAQGISSEFLAERGDESQAPPIELESLVIKNNHERLTAPDIKNDR